MKSKKNIIGVYGICLSLLCVTSLQAKESTNSIDALWASAETSLNTNKSNSNAWEKLALDRKRAVWKAKWKAEQQAKKQTIQPQKIKAYQTPKKLTREQYQWRWKQAQLKKQKSQSLQKQKNKQTVTNKAVLQTLQPIQRTPRLTHATFKSSKQAAAYQRLPLDIVTQLRASGIREYGVSAYVQDVNSPRPLLAYQESTSRVPASVMKLITSYAALGTLGPNYRWPLDVFTTGRIRQGTLNGNLYIKGYGSPEFNTAALRKVLRSIRQKGVRNINGKVVFDNSYFKPASQAAGAFDGKAQAAYNAKPDALLFNERINKFKIRTVGKRVKVTNLTPTHNLKIVNKMRKTRRSCRPRISVSHQKHQTVVTFSGKFARRCGTRTYARVISEPSRMIYGTMKSLWKREVGGQLNTQFAMGRVPANARPLIRTYSRTLAEILPTIDKDSNNVMARQLLLTIGAKKTGQTGTEKNGANAVGRWLASRGLNFPELRIENGSGLSRYARISAHHVGDLLVDAYRSPYRNVLMQSLAIAGVDGTMKRRLRGSNVKGRGFFKTGTLRDVRSIAGYVKAADGKTYVVAILHNDPKARRRALAAHDKLIEWVFDGGRKQQLAMR